MLIWCYTMLIHNRGGYYNSLILQALELLPGRAEYLPSSSLHLSGEVNLIFAIWGSCNNLLGCGTTRCGVLNLHSHKQCFYFFLNLHSHKRCFYYWFCRLKTIVSIYHAAQCLGSSYLPFFVPLFFQWDPWSLIFASTFVIYKSSHVVYLRGVIFLQLRVWFWQRLFRWFRWSQLR